jgi:hypothetical protein
LLPRRMALCKGFLGPSRAPAVSARPFAGNRGPVPRRPSGGGRNPGPTRDPGPGCRRGGVPRIPATVDRPRHPVGGAGATSAAAALGVERSGSTDTAVGSRVRSDLFHDDRPPEKASPVTDRR